MVVPHVEDAVDRLGRDVEECGRERAAVAVTRSAPQPCHDLLLRISSQQVVVEDVLARHPDEPQQQRDRHPRAVLAGGAVDEGRAAGDTDLAHQLDEMHRGLVEHREIEPVQIGDGFGTGPQRAQEGQVDDSHPVPGQRMDLLGLGRRPQVDHDGGWPRETGRTDVLRGGDGTAQDLARGDDAPVVRGQVADVAQIRGEVVHGSTLGVVRDTSSKGVLGQVASGRHRKIEVWSVPAELQPQH
jgi:hypothetical protein